MSGETKPKRDERGYWLPGVAGGPGRKAGIPNRQTKLVREAIEETFTLMGGVPALLKWAQQNESAFYTLLLPKLLPLQMKLEANIKNDFADILARARQRTAGNIIDAESVDD